MKGFMSYKIQSDTEILIDVELTSMDSDPELTLIPSFEGFQKKIFDDMDVLLYGPPLGDLDEVIEFTSEINAEKDDVNVMKLEIEITAPRYLVIAGLKGMHLPLNEHLTKFIKEDFFA